MPDDSDDVRARLEALERELRRVADRVARLEAAGTRTAAEAATPSDRPPAALLLGNVFEIGPTKGLATLVGRAVLALAGAYLIRALTDARILSPVAGVALGLAYALAWFVLADRAATKGSRAAASAYGLAAAFIAYPLLWEASTRLRLMTPAAALVALVAVVAAGNAVSARHGLAVVAWIGTLLALGALSALLAVTHELLGVVLALLAVAAILEGFAFRGRLAGLRWPAALVLDAAVLLSAWIGGRPEGLPEGYPPLSRYAAVVAVLAVPGLHLASTTARTLALGRAVGPFEVSQGAAALALGFWGAGRLVAAQGGSTFGLGVAAVVLGALCYAVAFALVERRGGPGTSFYSYSSAGGLLTLFGSRAVFEGSALALSWCALAVGATWLGCRFDRLTLRYHGAVWLGAAAVATGLIGSASRAMLADPRAGLTLPSAAASLAGATALLCGAVLAADRRAEGWRRTPHALVAALATWIVAGVLVAIGAQVGHTTRHDVVATLRTGVLAMLAVSLAATARRLDFAGLAWLVHLVLALGGLKLLWENVPAGGPAALFLSLGLYGAALIAAPRLLRAKG